MPEGSAPLRPPPAPTRPARVRTAEVGDSDAILDLIERHFGTGIPRAVWRRLFEYDWVERPHCGWVLDQGGRIVGFMGAIYSDREIGGRTERVCNLTSLCVDAEHRGMAPFLVMAAARQAGVTVTDLSPRTSVLAMLEKAGFRLLDPGKLLVPPLFNLGTKRPSITTDAEAIRATLEPAMQRILDDHVGYGCRPLLAQRGDGSCLLLVKRRRHVRRLPVSEILYASDPDFLARHMEAIVWRLTLGQRTLAVSGDRRLFGAHPPRGYLLKSISMVRTDRIDPAALDNLYSELVLLPI